MISKTDVFTTWEKGCDGTFGVPSKWWSSHGPIEDKSPKLWTIDDYRQCKSMQMYPLEICIQTRRTFYGDFTCENCDFVREITAKELLEAWNPKLSCSTNQSKNEVLRKSRSNGGPNRSKFLCELLGVETSALPEKRSKACEHPRAHSTHNGFHHQGTVKATRLPRFAHHLVPGPRWPWLIIPDA